MIERDILAPHNTRNNGELNAELQRPRTLGSKLKKLLRMTQLAKGGQEGKAGEKQTA